MAAEVDDRGVWFGLAKRFIFNSMVCKRKQNNSLKKKILCNVKVWLLACMLLVFLSLVEYAVILRQVIIIHNIHVYLSLVEYEYEYAIQWIIPISLSLSLEYPYNLHPCGHPQPCFFWWFLINIHVIFIGIKYVPNLYLHDNHPYHLHQNTDTSIKWALGKSLLLIRNLQHNHLSDPYHASNNMNLT